MLNIKNIETSTIITQNFKGELDNYNINVDISTTAAENKYDITLNEYKDHNGTRFTYNKKTNVIMCCTNFNKETTQELENLILNILQYLKIA